MLAPTKLKVVKKILVYQNQHRLIDKQTFNARRERVEQMEQEAQRRCTATRPSSQGKKAGRGRAKAQQQHPKEVVASSQADKLELERIANRNAQKLVDEDRKEEKNKRGKTKKKKTKNKLTALRYDDEAAAGAGAARVDATTAALSSAASAGEEDGKEKCEKCEGIEEAGARQSESVHSAVVRGVRGGAAGGAGRANEQAAVAAASALLESHCRCRGDVFGQVQPVRI
jgi:hypothetical protein